MPPNDPPSRPPPRPPHKSHVSSSAISGFIEPERLEPLLAPLVPDPSDRAFVLRCIVGSGPAHHRGANYVLLALLARLLEARGITPRALAGDTLPVPMRIPPHLTEGGPPPAFALALPIAPLEALAGDDPHTLAAMVDCITDGPPQHALANVAMVALLGQLLEDEGTEKP